MSKDRPLYSSLNPRTSCNLSVPISCLSRLKRLSVGSFVCVCDQLRTLEVVYNEFVSVWKLFSHKMECGIESSTCPPLLVPNRIYTSKGMCKTNSCSFLTLLTFLRSVYVVVKSLGSKGGRLASCDKL